MTGISVAAMGILAGGGFALVQAGSGGLGTPAGAAPGSSVNAVPAGNEAMIATRPRASSGQPSSASASQQRLATGKLTLTAAERHACPAAATACVDLPAHLTWLQSGGKVTYGPVRMEPGSGAQGTAHATPLGTWTVQWKAGADYVSSTYNEAMPWATFFAPGGIAFHGGSLTAASHGCVHLDIAAAKYYHDHLPVGAEVVVFKA